MELDGKVAVVTGAGRGLGRATALALAAQGARVAVLARSLPEVEETALRIRQDYGVGRSIAIRADVSSERDVQVAFDTVRRRWGGVDILVNNAGGMGATRPIVLLTLAEWQATLDVNLNGAFLCTREALKDMIPRRWGRIVSVSSAAAAIPVPGMSPYAVAKAALEHFASQVAAEAGQYGVMAMCLRPGVVDTRMQEEMRGRPSDSISPELHAAFSAYKDKGMLVPPERPARIIAYLCSDRPTSYLNGRALDSAEVEDLLAGQTGR
ncbi:MAG TPA: SDR family oxidoreductase [Chloroflexia bacterium]|nr:SDR family oxidoreductase [Chloroflexia bacterium]